MHRVIDLFHTRRVAREEAEQIRLQHQRNQQDPSSHDHTLPACPPCCSIPGESRPVHYPIRILRNIPYYSGPNALSRHQLDIYYSPTSMDEQRAKLKQDARDGVPIVIHVHGGGWQRGDRASEWRGAPNVGRAVARHGMIAIVPNYRLAPPAPLPLCLVIAIQTLLLTLIGSLFTPWISSSFLLRWFQLFFIFLLPTFAYQYTDKSKARHPEAAIDVCRVVAWVRDHLRDEAFKAELGEVDIDRIFLSGHSAGGHLVSLISSDDSYYRQVGLNDTSFIKGVCSISGVYTLVGPTHRNPETFRNRMFRRTYGAAAFGSRDVLIDASPITHLSRRAPPFLVMSATSDLGLENDAEMFCQRLKELQHPYEFHVIDNTDHTTIGTKFEHTHAHRHMFRFIDECCREGGYVRTGQDTCQSDE